MSTGTRDEVIDRLKRYYKEDDVIGIIVWSPIDVMVAYANTNLYDTPGRPEMTKDDAIMVLERVMRYHDASHGINWDTLEYYVREWYSEKTGEPNNIEHGDK